MTYDFLEIALCPVLAESRAHGEGLQKCAALPEMLLHQCGRNARDLAALHRCLFLDLLLKIVAYGIGKETERQNHQYQNGHKKPQTAAGNPVRNAYSDSHCLSFTVISTVHCPAAIG